VGSAPQEIDIELKNVQCLRLDFEGEGVLGPGPMRW
jgi:hypothetical protein